MNIEEINKGIVIKNIQNFHPIHTFECGQCFRWNKTDDNTYIGVVRDKVIEVELREWIYIFII